MAGKLSPIDADAVAEGRAGLPGPEILEGMVSAFEALADPTRVRLLYALMRRPLCVRDLAVTVQSSESAVSHQLRILRDRRLVRGVRKGHLIEYRLDDHHLAALFQQAEYHADHVRRGIPDHPYPRG